jgi:hypothetical protein
MLVDLRTGAVQRLTTMHPGQYALFPHFRSDGWIYFRGSRHSTGASAEEILRRPRARTLDSA